MSALRPWFCGLLSLTLLASRAQAEPPELLLESPASGDLDLSLSLRRDTGSTHSGTAGFLALALPLERFAAPKLYAQSAESAPAVQSAPPEPDAPPNDDVGIQPALAAPELARLTRETLRAALRRENVPARERQLDSLGARSKSSAVLPELRLRATRSHDEALRLAPTTDDPYRFSLAGGNALVLEASANWRLNRLVFADEELAVERMRLEEDRARERLVARVVEKVLAWHRALSYERTADERLRERATLERLEAEVELDVTTGGFFAERARTLLPRAPSSGPPKPAPAAPPAPLRSGRGGAEPPLAPCFPGAERSARSDAPCSPTHETDSRTFSGALMR